jgi:predicted AAA+ superfamily ATPase
MNRKIFSQLKQWKHSKERKPLILMGARQVGKTYILKAFAASEFDNSLYLNFENNPSLKTLFASSLKPEDILRALSIETNTKIDPGKTLIIFDEVQECPEALNSLKYFQESANHYHLCAAGSLLGVKLIHTKGFPVGKVNFLELFPLSFLEFLNAINETNLKEYIETIHSIEPVAANLHDKLLNYLKTYFFVGGMPEAITTYINTSDFNKVREIQDAILKAYSLDFAKHAPKEILMKINQVWESIPNQLAKENKKFVYSAIRQGARAKEFEAALQWLTEAGLIYKVHNISTPKLPLDAYAFFDFFKIYLLDVGLLGAMTNLSDKTIIHGDQLFQEFRGSYSENYVAQTLAQSHYHLYYWTSEGKAELDFVLQQEENIYPLEIKSGNSDKKKSLKIYNNTYHPELLIRSSPKNLRQDGKILNIPLYLLEELKVLLSKR